MALATVNAPVLNVGDTIADRPAAPGQYELFFDKGLGQISIFSGSAWQIGSASDWTATVTSLKAIPVASRAESMVVLVRADQSLWFFSSASSLTGDNVLVATPDAGTGRWLRLPGAVDLSLPITFATADAAVLLTFPTGSRFTLINPYWNVTTAFTGGTNASIGASSSKTGFSTKGDIIGATLLAALTAGIRPGAIGTGMDSLAETHTAIFIGGDTIRHDRIVDAFTAGVAELHLAGILSLNPGA